MRIGASTPRRPKPLRSPLEVAVEKRRQSLRRPIMRPSTAVALAVVIVAAIAILRSAKAADHHPGMTSDHPPGWQLQRALPGEDYKPRGRYFDNKQGCLLDLASDRYAMPSGTRLICLRIEIPTNRKASK